MTGYVSQRVLRRGDKYAAAYLLVNAWNHATSPSALRTDRQHQLQRLRAKLLRQRMWEVRDLVAETDSGRLRVVAK